VHVGDVDDANRRKPGLRAVTCASDTWLLSKTKIPNPLAPSTVRLRSWTFDTVPSNPDVPQCGCPGVNGEPIDGDAARSLDQ